jgi:THO complex subunit 2
LLGLLETVMGWHADPATFESECASFPGFLTIFRNAINNSGATPAAAAANKQEPLDYENFRHVCHKWHYKLTKSFIVCLESEEYLQMRNSLIILTKVIPHYPRLTGFCSALEKRVEKIKVSEKDRKQDIATLAMVYLGQLKARKAQMVDESKFHLKEPANPTATPAAGAKPASASESSSARSSSKSDAKQSSAKSQDFKQPTNPDSNTTTVQKSEVNKSYHIIITII